jgi:D-beta-D-heptose 7-phosphate kinase/D-beta-D-heptose 1-phosphate adenosyltransferase
MATDLSELVRRLGSPRVLVVGDVILDRYVFGFAERISQEAPVPILRVRNREERLGGAASVACMLSALGADVLLAGVVGENKEAVGAEKGRVAPFLRALFEKYGLKDTLVLTDPERPTTQKERYIGLAQDRHPQQILRVDDEVRTPLSSEVEEHLIRAIDSQLASCNIVLISDYDKGVCTPRLLRHVIDRSRALGLKVLVDPIRGSDYSRYRGATCLTPNRTEASLASGVAVRSTAEALEAGENLRQQLGAEALVVTLDREGMALAHADGRQQLFPTRMRQVYDITGAGDMVLSVLGLALAAGADYDAAIALGNVAGGLEVERLGVATLTRADLLHDLAGSPPLPGKVHRMDGLVVELERRRRQGERIVFTNGCFDVLHAGHVRYLQQARALGQVLVVGLNGDDSVRRLKGPTRPLNDVEARAEVLAALDCVDYVTVFDEDTPLKLIEATRPHVLVKGADYRLDEVVGRNLVESQGGQVVLIPLVAGQSTTRLVPFLKELAAV